jgi:hypothetical protein
MPDVATERRLAAPVPHSLIEYLRSFGPGIVIVLTWLGAGDVVDMGTAGANYGYAASRERCRWRRGVRADEMRDRTADIDAPYNVVGCHVRLSSNARPWRVGRPVN